MHVFRSKLFNAKQTLAFILPMFVVMGSFADTAKKVNTLDQGPKYIVPTDTLNFNSDQLGLKGPVQVGAQYSKLYGPMVTAQYSAPISEYQALAIGAEAGAKSYRLSATYGHQFLERHRVKVTAERLAQKMNFDFDSGSTDQWVGQNAVGAAYEYLVNKRYVNNLHSTGYYSKSKSKNLSSKVYSAGTNLRHIAGADSYGFAAGAESNPWKTGLVSADLNYDSVKYDSKYNANDNNTQGFGATVNYQQLVSNRLKTTIMASARAPYNEVNAGLNWLVNSRPGTRLEVGVNAGYVEGKTTGNNDVRGGVTVGYRWDGDPREKQTGYNLDRSENQLNIADWTAKPAVYMPEVLAVADQTTIANPIQQLSSEPIPDIDVTAGDTFHESIASHFAGPDDANITFGSDSSSPPPSSVRITNNGEVVGVGPSAEEDTSFTFDIVAKSEKYGSATQPVTLVVSPQTHPVPNGSIPPKTMQENTSGSINFNDYFSLQDPNAKAKGGKDDNKITYKLISPRQGHFQFNSETGILSGVAPIVDKTQSYKFVVVATNSYGDESKPTDFDLTVDPSKVTSTGDESETWTSGKPVNEDVVTGKFSTDAKNETLTYSADTAMLPRGIKFTNKGHLVGDPIYTADQDNSYSVPITATNVNGKTSSYTLNIDLEKRFVAPAAKGAMTAQGLYQNHYVKPVNVTDYFRGDIDHYSLSGNVPDGVTLNGNSISGDITTSAKAATYKMTVTAYSDADTSKGQSATQELDMTVYAVPATKGSIKAQTVTVGDTVSNVSVTPKFTGDIVSYSATGLPAGLSMSKDGVISGTATTATSSPVTATITATNEGSPNLNGDKADTADQTVQITVDAAAVPPAAQGSIADQNAYQGHAIQSVDVSTKFKGDIDHYSLTGAPAGITLSGNQITGTIDSGDKSGADKMTVTAYSSSDESTAEKATQSFTVNVFEVPASKGSIKAQTMTVGDTVSNVSVTPKFTGDIVSYSATGLPAGLSISKDGVISGTATTATSSPVTATITATNEGSPNLNGDKADTADQTVQITVDAAAVPPAAQGSIADQNAYQGHAIQSVDVSTKFKGDIDHYTLSGDVPAGITLNSNNQITGTIDSGDKSGASKMTVTAYSTSDESTAEKATQSFTLNVFEVPASKGSIKAQTMTVGDTVSNVSVTPKFTGDIVSYSATGLPAGLSMSKDGVISGTATTATSSPVTATITATNEGSPNLNGDKADTADQTVQITVDAAAVPPAAQGSIADQNAYQGHAISNVDVTGYFKGDIDHYKLTGDVPAGIALNSKNQITGTIDSSDKSGASKMTVTAYSTSDESTAQTATQSFTVNVYDVPKAKGSVPAQTLNVGDDLPKIDMSGYFTGDELKYKVDPRNPLPKGVTMDSDGVISGSPTEAFTGTAVIVATNAGSTYLNGDNPDAVTQDIKFTVTQDNSIHFDGLSTSIYNGAAVMTSTYPESSPIADLSKYLKDSQGQDFGDATYSIKSVKAVTSGATSASKIEGSIDVGKSSGKLYTPGNGIYAPSNASRDPNIRVKIFKYTVTVHAINNADNSKTADASFTLCISQDYKNKGKEGEIVANCDKGKMS